MSKRSEILLVFNLAAMILPLFHPLVFAQTQMRLLTLEQYETQAINQGIQAHLNQLSLESEGYTRTIAFRKTDSPSFTYNRTDMKGETTVNGFPFLSNSQQNNLLMQETTPLGTTMNAAARWDYFGGTRDPASTIERPGFSADVTQPLYLFVKNPVRRIRQGADLNFANARSTFQATELSLRTQARNFYYNVQLETESVEADQRKVDSSKRLLDVTQALVQAGKSASVDIMRAKIQLQEDQRRLENDVVQREQALLQAKQFADLPMNDDLRFVTALSAAPFKRSVDRLLEYAILHNPTLESLQISQELARLSYEAAIEPTRPTFALNGTYNTTDARTQPDLVTHGWTWTSTINWLFFDSFVTRDQAHKAQIAQWVADLNLNNALLSVEVAVRSSFMDIKRTEKQINDMQFSLEQGKRNVEVLRLRFQHGLTNLLDVLNAEDQERGLNAEYLLLLVQFNQAKDRLSEGLGADVEKIQ